MFYLAISMLLTVLGLPPFGMTVAGLTCWIPLFVLVGRESGGRAAFYGACYGFVVAAYVFLGAFAYSAVVYALTIIALSAVFSIFLYLASRLLSGKTTLGALHCAIVWVMMEMICEVLKLPFTAVLAVTQAPVLLQTAELGGQYLVSFLFVLFQASAAMTIAGGGARARLVHAAGALLAIALTGGYAASTAVDAWRTEAGVLRAAVVQTDVHPALTENWKADGQLQTLADIRRGIHAELAGLDPPPELVVWPEVWFAGLEMRRRRPPDTASGAAMLIGAPDSDELGRRINAVFSVAADGEVLHRHGKRVLLPLLEDEYAQGAAPEPHRQVAGVPGSLICFESAFAGAARSLTLAGAKSLAVSTSDAYAGPSFLALMHHDLARIRAVENRRTILRAANGGPSSIIEPSGEIRQRLGLYQPGILAQTVPLVEHLTLYTRYGQWWRLAWLAMLCFPALALWRKRHLHPRQPVAAPLLGTGIAALVGAFGLCALQVVYAATVYQTVKPGPHRAAYTIAFRGQLRGIEWRYDELTVRDGDPTQHAALAYLLREHGVPASSETLLEMAAEGGAGIEQLAANFGFEISIQEYPEPAQVFSLPTPVLIELTSGETVVLQELDRNRASFFSPLQGEHIAIKRGAFVEAWRGATLRLVGNTAGQGKHADPISPMQ